MLQSLLWWEVGVDKSEHILTVTWETVVLFVFLTSTCKLQGLEIQPPTLWLMDDCSKAWATGQPIWICCYNAMFSWEALVPGIQVRYFDTHHQVHLLTATELRDGSGQRSKTMLYSTRGICQRAQGRPPNFIYAIWSRIQGMCWNKSNPWRPIPWCQKPKNTGTVSLPLQVSSLIHNGSSMDWTSSTDAQSNWDLGNPETKLMPWALCHISQGNPEQFFCCVTGRTVLLGGLLPVSPFNVVWCIYRGATELLDEQVQMTGEGQKLWISEVWIDLSNVCKD